MNQDILIGLSAILIIGIAAQWLSWRLKLSSVLLLLLCGFVIGPITNFVNPDILFGELLFPFVSLMVGIILFEGGLSLKFGELRHIRAAVFSLVTAGIALTWLLTTVTAYFVIGLNFYLSILLGSILVVTGPTVIIPILEQLHLKNRVGSTLKWEGILNDAIGVVLSVLVFEAIILGRFNDATSLWAMGLIKTFFMCLLVGGSASVLLIFLLRRYWIPDFLREIVPLMVVISSFSISNLIQNESGLLTVTLMGIILANQRFSKVKQLAVFNENLRTLFISLLFVVLAARIHLEQLLLIDWRIISFVAILILVIRPVSVYVSTLFSKIRWNEKTFLAFMAPRGIVATAMSSIFAWELMELHFPQAEKFLAVIFFAIVVTILLYGLAASPLARKLRVAQPNSQGVLLVGAHAWARELAKMLNQLGVEVLLIDTHRPDIKEAQLAGLSKHYGNILSEEIVHEAQLGNIKRLLALTGNDEVNSLAVLHFEKIFGHSGVFQLSPRRSELSFELHGRILFGEKITFDYLQSLYEQGGKIKSTNITKEFTFDHFKKMYGDQSVLLCLIKENGNLDLITKDHPTKPKAGHKLIFMATK